MLPRITLLFFCLFTFCSSISAQSVVNIGNENTLEIATWNIEWFGNSSNGPSNDALQLQNVAQIIAESGIDLWGVQEIADATDFETLLDDLGDNFDGFLATNSVEQKVGFVFNTDVIRIRQSRHILESFAFEFASRPPLQLEAEVTLPSGSTTVTFIVLHMKAFSDPDSYARRVDASTRLKNHIDFILPDDQVIVLGDFNDELERSTSGGRTSPYDNFVQDTDNFSFLTLPLEEANEGSFCTNSSCTSTGSMLDHILITNELFLGYIPESAGFIPDLTTSISSFGSSTSDHLPVVARFDFEPIIASNEQPDDFSDSIQLTHPYPNPFLESTTISYTVSQASHLKIEVFDLLGRKVDTLLDRFHVPGAYNQRFSSDAPKAGTYLVRFTTDNASTVVPVTQLR